MEHKLKILPAFFNAVICGDKNFEIRDNSDRGFQKGDTVILEEFDNSAPPLLLGSFTGRSIAVEVTYVTGYEQKPGWVVFGFTPLAQ